MQDEMKYSMEQKSRSVLQAGMVSLKNFLSLCDQVLLYLGLGLGGFYQPSYRNGAKLNLEMICLGKNYRHVDGAKPLKIPIKFFQLVESAIKESHSFIRKDSKASNA
ncbi:hypothetical protein D8674_019020 [Pyrus ussuriensis x Pyrus communis]|uniref:Uncharacterized protein n=1 Tax=Pyrus ussuriensis x Pyrus communis TaxID=2448454 RepID=A0A5N5G6V9_9ROSA|nr:hypothetical protein D8674_019020 [Pyrus ussuriensis x Pyrus communis]